MSKRAARRAAGLPPSVKPSGAAKRGDYEVREVPFKVGTAFIRKHHYTRSTSNTAVLLLGLYRGGELVGVAHWLPAILPAAKYTARACGGDPRRVLTLSRLAIAPGEPQNAASMLLGAGLRRLRVTKRWDAVVTYADEGQGHKGTIYDATNWIRCGYGRRATRWVDPETGRHVSPKGGACTNRGTKNRTAAQMEALGYKREGAFRKPRFFYPLRKGARCVCPE